MDNKMIGYRIKSRRESLGLTLDEVAARVGLNKSTIQRYETGRIESPKLPVLEVIAKCLSVAPDWLACKSDEMSLPVSVPAVEVPVSGSGNVGSVIVFKPGTMDEKALEAVKEFIRQMGGEVL